MSKNNPVTNVMLSTHDGIVWLTIFRKKDDVEVQRYYILAGEYRHSKMPGTFLRRCFSILTAFNANGLNGNLKFNALKDD